MNEDLTTLLLQGQQKTNDMLLSMQKEITTLTTKLTERERHEKEQELSRQQEIHDIHDDIDNIKKDTAENTADINKIKGGWMLASFIVAIFSMAVSAFSYWMH